MNPCGIVLLPKIYDSNLLAFVPIQLKSIALINVRQDDVQISFIDADSLHIVREIQFHRIDSLSQLKSQIANSIIKAIR
jgi:hypothetical protein